MCMRVVENKQILAFSLYDIAYYISTQKIKMDHNIWSLADQDFIDKFISRTEF